MGSHHKMFSYTANGYFKIKQNIVMLVNCTVEQKSIECYCNVLFNVIRVNFFVNHILESRK